MGKLDIYKTEFANSSRDELIYCFEKATRTPLSMDIYRWKMGMITAEQVMAKHGFGRTALKKRLTEYKETQEAYLISCKQKAQFDQAAFEAEVESGYEWLEELELDDEF